MMKAQIKTIDGMQAVLLPAGTEMPSGEVFIRRDPNSGDLVLSSHPASWDGFFDQDRLDEIPQDFMNSQDRFGGEPPRTTLEALASAWQGIAVEVDFPAEFDGLPTPEAHRATEALEQLLREHLIAAKDQRLFALMHLLGLAALRMEQVI
ncbi:MAG TPA: hypothetical protein PKV17_00570 [Aquabacterium sp.]|nr:hypothetical protein [Aquabacterium sp.]